MKVLLFYTFCWGVPIEMHYSVLAMLKIATLTYLFAQDPKILDRSQFLDSVDPKPTLSKNEDIGESWILSVEFIVGPYRSWIIYRKKPAGSLTG